MNKNTYFVIEQQEIETGRTIAHAETVSNCYNLLDYFKPFHGCKIISINACDTKKESEKIAEFWNDCARKNNNYMFQ